MADHNIYILYILYIILYNMHAQVIKYIYMLIIVYQCPIYGLVSVLRTYTL
jgi:hypothetical protein